MKIFSTILSLLILISSLLLAQQPQSNAKTSEKSASVIVVPNPCRYSESPNLYFNNVPPRSKILIFSLDGIRLDQLQYQGDQMGQVSWNPPRAFGLFIFVVESQNKKYIGKFAIMP
jgi:hypothetical protein